MWASRTECGFSDFMEVPEAAELSCWPCISSLSFFLGGGTVNGTLNFSFSNHSMLVYGKIIIFFSLFRKILFC